MWHHLSCCHLPARTYLQEATIDLEDDLQVTGQQVLEQVNGPALQGLRQHGVVCVGTGTDTHVPGLETQKDRGKIIGCI
jgi:hypothetical protein